MPGQVVAYFLPIGYNDRVESVLICRQTEAGAGYGAGEVSLSDEEKKYYLSMSKELGREKFIAQRLKQLKSNARFYTIFLAVVAAAITAEVIWMIVMQRYGFGSWIATAIGVAALVFGGLHLKNIRMLRREYEAERGKDPSDPSGKDESDAHAAP